MKGIEKTIIGPSSAGPLNTSSNIISATGGTNQLMTEVDLANYSLAREFVLSGRLLGNTTAVGASKYLALNWYWSDYKISTIDSTLVAANTLLLLARRKFTTGPMLLDNLTLANGGDVMTRFVPAITLAALTTTASTTTATITLPAGAAQRMNVGDLITVSGGTVTGDGAQMRGTYAIATVTNSATAATITYTITSTSGTLVGATVQVANTIRQGGNDLIAYGIHRPVARYLYVSCDTPAFTTDATIALTVALCRVPSTDVDLL